VIVCLTFVIECLTLQPHTRCKSTTSQHHLHGFTTSFQLLPTQFKFSTTLKPSPLSQFKEPSPQFQTKTRAFSITIIINQHQSFTITVLNLQLTPNPCLLSHLCLLLLCSANSIQNPKTNPSRNYLMDSSHHNHRQFLNLTLSATKQVKPNMQINFIKSIQHQPIPILLEPVLDSTLPRPCLFAPSLILTTAATMATQAS
jgi:hypothetical protein